MSDIFHDINHILVWTRIINRENTRCVSHAISIGYVLFVKPENLTRVRRVFEPTNFEHDKSVVVYIMSRRTNLYRQ